MTGVGRPVGDGDPLAGYPGPYVVGDITISVSADANGECQRLMPKPFTVYRGCWVRLPDGRHWIVTNGEARVLVHELKHVSEGLFHE